MPSRRTNKFPWKWTWLSLLGHVTTRIFGSTVGYPSESLASCHRRVPAEFFFRLIFGWTYSAYISASRIFFGWFSADRNSAANPDTDLYSAVALVYYRRWRVRGEQWRLSVVVWEHNRVVRLPLSTRLPARRRPSTLPRSQTLIIVACSHRSAERNTSEIKLISNKNSKSLLRCTGWAKLSDTTLHFCL